MISRFWRKPAAAARKQKSEFRDEGPLVAQTPQERTGEPQKAALQKIAPIAREEKGKVAAQLKRVDIALDGYDDIFSDFDPSPFSSRLLSRDLIEEVTRRYRETKEGEVEVRFTVPGKRNKEDEAVIRARLGMYFKMQARSVEEQLSEKKRSGVVLLVAGLSLVTLQKVISKMLGETGFYDYFYQWIEEPMVLFGWISTWVGADRIFLQKPEELIERKVMLERFARANFVFISEETIKKGVEGKPKPQEKKEKKQVEAAPAAERPGMPPG